ncbi:MAG TPA: polyphenol oxidase family protein [Polyangiaceae bacterium]|jgi:hypothetical protein
MSALESALLRAAGFRHGFSVRPWDFKNDFERSAEAISLLLRLPRERLYRVSQVHGARAVRAEGDVAALAKEEADALVAREPSTAVAVRVADCVPILLANSETGAVAAVHAGWRGVVAGVIDGALELGRFDLAAIGPCIGACCFEIGDDVARKLAPHVKENHGDLRGAVRAQLRARGLQDAHIEDVDGCTMCDADRFFSFRRDGEASGRHLAVIAVRS